MNAKQRKAVDDRIHKEKEKLLEMLRKTPVAHVACERAGVSKATYYRWREEDPDFAQKADVAFSEGKELVSDIAISQLISAIKDKSMAGIKFWLTNHHADYKNKVEIGGTVNVKQEISPEDWAIIEASLRNGKLIDKNHGTG